MHTLHKISDVLGSLAYRCDEDVTDRMNYHYTCCLFLFLSALVTARNLVGHRIECWVPATFTQAMESYAENFCYVQGTYYVPLGYELPNVLTDRDEKRFGYYQWVPFYLAVEACLVYAPSVAWKIFKSRAGNDSHIVR